MVFERAMRDVERLREKREFSLDDRQMWALSLSALLLLGGMFTLGLVVGRRMTPPPAAAPVEVAEATPVVVPARPTPVVEEKKPPPVIEEKQPEKPAQGRAPVTVAA